MVTVVSQEDMAALVSRTGRQLQRYNKAGRRQVVGCIPYRYKMMTDENSLEGEENLQVLLISSQKGKGMLFPKGGWELDESKKEAASRESLEEAGVRGIVEAKLGKWIFKSKTYDTFYEGYMFPLFVQEELDIWPEKNVRKRQWVNVTEARRSCQHWWMKEALDILVRRLATQQRHNHFTHKEIGYSSLS
ncbi:nudix hydrolase 18, mitochondrial-like [Carica papaya]|uniref:nudix hydrolase 18, mitochondrial-like n=1 Tax=Carica papaya TaxID=3649 RepID=UPI000B8CCD77|nr:nudix hydrolase 18, mitochondrial-like [Carica papaya]